MRANIILPFFLIFLLYFGICHLMAEEDTPVSQDTAPAPQNTAPASGEKISLDLQGVDISELLKMLSLKSGLTIISTPEVQGRVTVFLNNLTFEDALDVVITKQNLAYERKEGMVKVMTSAQYEAIFGQKFGERKEVKTIKLKYAKPANIFNIISPLKTAAGKIIIDETSGVLLVIDSPPAAALIEQTINEFDQPLETEVFNINYANAKEIKSYIENLVTPGLGQVITDERSDKVIVTDLAKRLEKIRIVLRELDEESRQVLITGEIVQVTLTNKFQRGIDWEKVFSSISDLDTAGYYPITLSNYQKISVGTLASDNYEFALNLLQEYGDTKVLSRPRIVAVNKEEAKILVGSREAYVTTTMSQSDTVVTAENVQFVDIGVKLTVVPTIGRDGFVTMKIKPEVSSAPTTVTTSSGSRIPIVETSEVETVVKVKDGSTIMIGGLLKEEKSDEMSGVPGLSKIPVLGALFSSKTKDNPRTELVIFLTPQIISGENPRKSNAKGQITNDKAQNPK